MGKPQLSVRPQVGAFPLSFATRLFVIEGQSSSNGSSNGWAVARGYPAVEGSVESGAPVTVHNGCYVHHVLHGTATEARAFEGLLEQLAAAHLADEDSRRRGSSLAGRVASRERLVCLRGALARTQERLESEPMPVVGRRDSRTTSGVIVE